MNDLSACQLTNNVESRDRWDRFGGHRAKVTELLRSVPCGAGRRLCILGAGNCNDLDLTSLLEVYDEVHLVDLDTEALSLGAIRQGVAEHPRLHLRGGVDLSGMLKTISGWSAETAISQDDLRGLVNFPMRDSAPSLPKPFDVVVSMCMLSQLIRNIVAVLGEAHPHFLATMQAIRAGHLRLLAHLSNPGGLAMLITDIVSSETCPELATTPEGSLDELVARLVRDRNFFHGVNPLILVVPPMLDPVLNQEMVFRPPVPAWVWDFGPRLYLVTAFTYSKREGLIRQ